MKTKLFLSSLLFLSALIFSGTAYSQHSGCDAKTEQSGSLDKACCKESTGNAGSDSTIAVLTCPVSGEEIAEGKGINFDYYGKTYTFCCEGCLAKFKKEPFDYLKEEINCPVMGEPIVKDVFVMHNGTKYYLCCKSCLKKFENDPEKYIKSEKKEEHKH